MNASLMLSRVNGV